MKTSLNNHLLNRTCLNGMLGSVRPDFVPAEIIALSFNGIGYQDKKSENRIAGRYRHRDLT